MGFLNKIWTKIKSLAVSFWNDLVDTWERIKIYALFLISIVVYFEWRKIKEALLVYSAKKENSSDNKQNEILIQNENNENNQANNLIQQAQQLPNQEQPVTEDWYVKKDQK